jgi:hypothetical protein
MTSIDNRQCESSRPELSIVVPTAGRVELVGALLRSVREVTATDGIAVETLIVDSSNTREQEQIVDLCSIHGARLIPGPASVSAKRNFGAEQAQADYILFLDSDCEPQPGAFRAHRNELVHRGVDASYGAVDFHGERSFWFAVIAASGLLAAFAPPGGGAFADWAPSANLAVRRTAFLATGFDATLGPPGLGGEDVDFGLRFTAGGRAIAGNPEAIVRHTTATWNHPFDVVKRLWSWGRADLHLILRHPERSYLDLPSPAVVLALWMALGLVGAMTDLRCILAGPLAVATYVAIAGALTSRLNRNQATCAALFFSPLVFVLLDLGKTAEGLRTSSYAGIWRRLRHDPQQIEHEWPELVASAAGNWAATLVAACYIGLILSGLR